MKLLLKQGVSVLPHGGLTKPRIRMRIVASRFEDAVAIVEGTPLGDPIEARVIYDSTVPIEEAEGYAQVFADLAESVRRQVAAAKAEGVA